MKNKIRKIIGFLIIIILAYFYAHIAKLNVIYDKHVDNKYYISTGVAQSEVAQKFVCVEDTLDGITAKCSVPDTKDGASVALILYDENGKKVAESELSTSEMKNSKFNKFSFETVKNCKGKTYWAVFKNVNANIAEGKGVSFYYEGKVEDGSELKIDSKDIDGTMIMKTVTNRFDLETMLVLLVFIAYIVIFMRVLYKLFK